MNHIAIIVAIGVAYIGHAESFSFNDEPYEVEQLGSTYVVYLKHRTVSARDISKMAKTDCRSLKAEIEEAKENFHICLEDPQSSFCGLVRHNILFLSKEEYFQSPPLLYSAHRRWELSTERSRTPEAELKEFVAALLSVNPNHVQVVEPRRSKPMGPLSISLKPSALLSAIGALIPMDNGGLHQPKLIDTHLVNNNRLFACDLEEKRVTVGASFVATLTSEESYSEEVISVLWKLYADLARFVNQDDYKNASMLLKSAMVGEIVGLHLKRAHLNDSRITMPTIFSTWLTDDKHSVALKNFASIHEFKHALYPNQVLSKDVELSWSTQ